MDDAAVGALKPGDDIEERALAGAVRADDADDLAGPDRDLVVLQRDKAAEGFRQPTRSQQRRPAGLSTAAICLPSLPAPDRPEVSIGGPPELNMIADGQASWSEAPLASVDASLRHAEPRLLWAHAITARSRALSNHLLPGYGPLPPSNLPRALIRMHAGQLFFAALSHRWHPDHGRLQAACE